MFTAGVITGAVIASSDRSYEREERYYPAPAPIYIIAQPPAAAAPRAPAPQPAPPPPPPFDAKHARSALSEIDLAACRAEGAPRGYGHAKVTFNPSGDISKVVIDEPAKMSPAAAKCIGDAIGRATVPLFNGSLVTMGTTWYVP